MQDMLMKIFIVDILLEGGQNNNKKIIQNWTTKYHASDLVFL